MTEYKRPYPLFSLCGLNCGLCPRYQTRGASKCPGCGGPQFHLKHPTCAVITCNKQHDNVEYCFQCTAFPCARYEKSGEADSFISYRNVIRDLNQTKSKGIEKYQNELNEKVQILEYLLNHYNDGKRKGFYCIAINLLNLSEVRNIMQQIDENIKNQDIDMKEKIKLIVELFELKAKRHNIELKLRK